jgi:hypothetical protein
MKTLDTSVFGPRDAHENGHVLFLLFAGASGAQAAGKTKGTKARTRHPIGAGARAAPRSAHHRAAHRRTRRRRPPRPSPSPRVGQVTEGEGVHLQRPRRGGKLKTPQLLYFLNRVKMELDTTGREKRSFLKELEQSSDDKGL